MEFVVSEPIQASLRGLPLLLWAGAESTLLSEDEMRTGGWSFVSFHVTAALFQARIKPPDNQWDGMYTQGDHHIFVC